MSRYRVQSPSGSEVLALKRPGKVPRAISRSPLGRVVPDDLDGFLCGGPVAVPLLSRHARTQRVVAGPGGETRSLVGSLLHSGGARVRPEKCSPGPTYDPSYQRPRILTDPGAFSFEHEAGAVRQIDGTGGQVYSRA